MPNDKPPGKPRIEDTHFFKLHKMLQSRPNDRALRVDRWILEGMMMELISAAKRLEKIQAAAKLLAPALDFTSDESPQDTILSLFREARDAVMAVAAHEENEGILLVDDAPDLIERMNGLIGEP